MNYIKLLTVIILFPLIISCADKPDLSQTISYLENKIHNTSISGRGIEVVNEKFKIDNNIVSYIAVTNVLKDNFKVREIYEFSLDDIYSISIGESIGREFINIWLSKPSGQVIREPLNDYSASRITELGFAKQEWIKDVNVYTNNREELQKAFLTIRDIIRDNRGDSYFED